ncbi:MAG TPA: NADH-quinone oxidoreductase subunit NuoE [Dehalococcoidia bacterium]|nr:NADH-quinone oxidoreductase subunit NuoE [Dehalococcoidia bacterium]
MSVDLWEAKVGEVTEQRGKSRTALLPCLEAIQEVSGYIPQEAISYLRETLDVPAVDIYGVISFYGMLTTREQGKYVIRLCNSLPCFLNGSDTLLSAVERETKIKAGETSPDKKFTLEAVACLGLCDEAPAMMINDKTYGNLTEKTVREIIAGLEG